MRHAADPDELLEVLGDELRPVVRDDSWCHAREAFPGTLHDLLDVCLGHRRTDLPVNDGAATAVEDAAQVVERASDVEVSDVHVPVFMRLPRLNEALALGGGFAVVPLK